MKKRIPFDYASMTVGEQTRRGPIVVCPICGRNGALINYADGTHLVTHAGYIEFGFHNTTDHCTPPPTPREIGRAVRKEVKS